MSDFMKYAYDLADEIGPRPANTEEEHQAAEKIADWFSAGGASADIEEFNCPTASRWPFLVAYLLMFIAAFCTRLRGTLATIMFIVGLVALALFLCERYIHPFLGGLFTGGLSQNVLARVSPEGDAPTPGKKRKIIIMARYDSSHAAVESNRSLAKFYPLIQTIMLVCMVALPLLMLFQLIPGMRSARSVLWIISLVLSLVPLAGAVFIIIRRFALRFPDGANDNASGIAAMMEVYDRMVGLSDEAEAAPPVQEDVEVHDEETAYDAGVVPDEARLHYVASRRTGGDEDLKDEPASADDYDYAAQEAYAETAPHETNEMQPVEPQVAEPAAADYPEADRAQQAPVTATPSEFTIGGAIDQSKAAMQLADLQSQVPQQTIAPQQITGQQAAPQAAPKKAKPEWWTKVESKRKGESAEKVNPEFAGLRSRYADIPSSTYHRASEELPEDSVGALEEKRQQEAARLEEMNKSAVGAMQDEPVQAVASPNPMQPEVAPSDLDERSQAFLAVNSGASVEMAPVKAQPEAAMRVPNDADANSQQDTITEDSAAGQIPYTPPTAQQRAERQAEQIEHDARIRERTERDRIEREYEERSVPSQVFRAERPEGRQKPHPTEVRPEEDEFIDDSAFEVEDRPTQEDTTRMTDKTTPDPDPEPAVADDVEIREQPKKRRGFHMHHRNKKAERAREAESFESEPSPDEQEPEYEEPAPETPRAEVHEQAPQEVHERHPEPQPREQIPEHRHEVPRVERAEATEDRASGKKPVRERNIPDIGTSDQEDRRSTGHSSLSNIPSIESGPAFGDKTAEQRAHEGQGLAPLDSDQGDAANLDKTMAALKQPTPIDSQYSDTIQRSRNYRSQGEEAAFTPLEGDDDGHEKGIFDTGSFAAGETGAFVPVGSSGTFKPVSDDMIIDDADDTSAGIGYGTDDFSAPQQLDMPDSRVSRFGRKHSRKKDTDDQGAAEWLGLDEDYNPTKAGKDIGSWDNFEEDENWKGGAASSRKRSQTDEGEVREKVKHRARENRPKEVWFLALGASEQDNAGIKAFLKEHADELKGATFINIRAVGAGKLACLAHEGLAGSGAASDPRTQGLAKRAAKATGHSLDVCDLKGFTTDAVPVLKARHRAVTLMAFDDKAPVGWQQSDDTSDSLSEDNVRAVADIVSEMVRKS